MRQLLFLIALLIPLSAEAATKTLCASGCDYNTGSAWVTYLQGVSPLSEPEILEVTESRETVIQFGGTITTSAANYVEVRGAASCKHEGFYQSGDCELKRTSGNSFVIYNGGSVANLRITDLVVSSAAEGSDTILMEGLVTGEIIIRNVIVRSTDASPTAASGLNLIASGSGATTIKVLNSIAHGFGGFGAKINVRANDTLLAYNNTTAGNGTGWRVSCGEGTSDAYKVRNHLSTDNTTDFDFADAGPCGVRGIRSHNFSEDATGTSGHTGVSVTYVGAGDYRLDSSDTGAKDLGGDLSADGDLAITDDIVGTSRPQGSAFDVGAFEIVVAASGNTQIIHAIGED